MSKSKSLLEDLQSLLQEKRKVYHPGAVRIWGGKAYEKQKTGKWKKLPEKHLRGNVGTEIDTEAVRQKVKGRLPEPPSFDEHVEIAKNMVARHRTSLPEKLRVLESLAPGAEVLGRVKEVESAVEKIARKPKYGRADNLQDISGTRVVAKSIDEVMGIVKKIKETYEVLEEDDFISRPNDGYRSYHITARDSNGLDFEIQVRTANQDTWGDWAHNVYKPLTPEQEEALKANREVVDDYRLRTSAYFYSQDTHSGPSLDPPDCPPIVKQTFGCIT